MGFAAAAMAFRICRWSTVFAIKSSQTVQGGIHGDDIADASRPEERIAPLLALVH
jgi:hypothetical protein